MSDIPKIHAISDTHFSHEDIFLRGGDILIVAGDMLGHGKVEELVVFNEWLGRQPYKHRIVIAGNHDWACEDVLLTRKLLSNCTYLHNDSTVVMGLKIFGSPFSPAFNNWCFGYERASAHSLRLWGSVPEDTDILISHGPASGTGLGMIKGRFDDIGCWDLRTRIEHLPNLKVHICGHIHGGYGVSNIGTVKCYNVSVMDEGYQIANPYSVIEW